jgi:hypothetical protein
MGKDPYKICAITKYVHSILKSTEKTPTTTISKRERIKEKIN